MKSLQSNGLYKTHNNFGTYSGKLVASTDPRKENVLREIRKLDHLSNQTNYTNAKSK